MKPRYPSIIAGVFTQLSGVGGIERFSRHAASVMADFARERGLGCEILSLNDAKGGHRECVGKCTFRFSGFARSKIAIALALLKHSYRADFVCIGHANFAPLALPLKMMRPGLPLWIPVYGIEVWARRGLAIRRGLQKATVVTAISEHTRAQLARQDLDPRTVEILTPVLEPGFLDYVREPVAHAGADGLRPAIPPGRAVLTVSRLSAHDQAKGIDMVIGAMPSLLKAVPDAYYVVVGEGRDTQRLRKLARDRGVESHVIFAGKRSERELQLYYQACDVFVMPSQKEGFGIVFLEAMAAGKPVIGGSGGGTRQVIQDGIHGFLIDQGDDSGLVSRLITLLSDEQLRDRMGAAGRKLVEDHHTFAGFRHNVEDLMIRFGKFRSGPAGRASRLASVYPDGSQSCSQ